LVAEQLRADAAPFTVGGCPRAALSRCGDQPPPGALRAPWS